MFRLVVHKSIGRDLCAEYIHTYVRSTSDIHLNPVGIRDKGSFFLFYTPPQRA